LETERWGHLCCYRRNTGEGRPVLRVDDDKNKNKNKNNIIIIITIINFSE